MNSRESPWFKGGMRTTALILLVALLLAPRAYAEDDRGAAALLEGLSGDAAMEHVKALAADAMQGRKTGFESGTKAEMWVAGKMAEYGLHPADAGGTYLEPFRFGTTELTGPVVCKISGQELVYGKDYFALLYSGGGKVTAPVVFCGYGIARPDRGWDDYAGIDVKGKIVMAIRGAPKARAQQFEQERFIGYKSSTAFDKGAVGFILVQGDNASTGTIQEQFHRPKLPAVWISGAAADRILKASGQNLATLKKQRDEGQPGRSFATGATASLEVNSKFIPNATGHNVLGMIKGRDASLRNEIIVLSAHIDHLGVDPNGGVYNGADDNASGTAVMLHLADLLTKNRWKPKRSILFCGFGAEEQGLVGSHALARRYPFEGQIVAVLNMDMVGQGQPAVSVSGGAGFPLIEGILADALPDNLRSATEFKARTGGFSDHWPFYERGIPAFAISTRGKHPNYHTPADDVEGIKPACLEAAAQVVGRWLIALGNEREALGRIQVKLGYLLREGPRFGYAILQDDGSLRTIRNLKGLKGKAQPAFDAVEGVSALIVEVNGDPAKSWRVLEGLARPDGPYVLFRRSADIGRAFQAGKLALVPRLNCRDALHADASRASAFAALGYRWLAPFTRGAKFAFRPEDVRRVVTACRQAGVLFDTGRLTGHNVHAALQAAQGAPLMRFFQPERSSALENDRKRMGAQLLLLLFGDNSHLLFPSAVVTPKGGSPATIVSGDTEALVESIVQWGLQQPEGTFEPHTPTRKAIRSALGGRLVEWLRRTDR